MNKRERKAIAEETLRILHEGGYESPGGKEVSICSDLIKSKLHSYTYAQRELDEKCSEFRAGDGDETQFSVTDETTFGAASRFRHSCPDRIAVLNFASAKNPGGGFLTGAQAQEECLARASGLLAGIKGSPMYEVNRKNPRRGLYADMVIYTPDCPVFRDDEDKLLDKHYCVDIITAPAVNAQHAKDKGVRPTQIRAAMKKRIQHVLTVAADHQVKILILGAFGCGVFGNDTNHVAQDFSLLLNGQFRNVFDQVVFAIPGAESRNHQAFAYTRF